ncbi:uncharacterized protein LOC134535798 [Bacillus rossius redtenbacheri]|uniref:uncharacterized protein LOC134535798 n=1 Tax=Bacillus rossius redtenbacheri TaxID=93214 RepID=UPI002FDD1947
MSRAVDGEHVSEANGGSSSHPGKRKKGRRKNRSEFLQEWLDKSDAFQSQVDSAFSPDVESEDVMGYWPQHGPLTPAVSDPAVCRYSVPLGYSLEPVSLPVYPLYSPVPVASWSQPLQKASPRLVRRGQPCRAAHDGWHRTGCVGAPRSVHPSRPGAMPRLKEDSDQVNGQEFASLPPVTQPQGGAESGRRRFSDPGLGPPSRGSSGSGSGSSWTAGLLPGLVEQVGALQESSRQLQRELRSTRAELEALKTRAAAWGRPPEGYQPGLLADLVREVRDAAKVREEALLSRVCSMIKAADISKLNCLQVSATDATDCNFKVSKQVQSEAPKLHNSHGEQEKENRDIVNNNSGDDSSMSQQFLELEKEKLELRRELQEVIARANKSERLVGVLRKKINAMSVEEKTGPASLEQCSSSLENTSESLVSTVSGSSSCSPHVTISGPVTEL